MKTAITGRRCGMTLLEVLLAITVLTALAAVAVRLLDSMLRMQHAAGRHAQAALDLNRLADSLRRDARQAKNVQVLGKQRQVQFSNTGTDAQAADQIRYTIAHQVVQREVFRGGELAARESFVLISPAAFVGQPTRRPYRGAMWRWDPDSGVVALQLPSRAGGRQAPMRIEAVVAVEPADVDQEVAP